jgi:CubicO group peptidase (beta-lactamase class C family)
LNEVPPGAPGQGQGIISGIGWGGQRLCVLPGLDLAVAMNAGNCPKPGIEQRRIADVLLRELVLPAVM